MVQNTIRRGSIPETHAFSRTRSRSAGSLARPRQQSAMKCRVIEDSDEELAVLLEEEGAQFKPEDWPLYMPALNEPRRMEVVLDGLVGRGYSEDHVDKIMGLNLLRLYTDILS